MVTQVSALAGQFLMLNPIAQVIQDVRHNLITSETVTTWSLLGERWWLCLVPLVVVVVVFFLGASVFRKRSKYFAEEV